MNSAASFRRLLCIVALLAATAAQAAETLKINGSTTVNLPVAEAAEILRAEQKLNIQVDTQGGSAGGISMLGMEWCRSACRRSR
jgi:phosphate transport system substrate-binding protein